MSIPKSTRSRVLGHIAYLYYPRITHWHYIGSFSRLGAGLQEDEKYHLIANAANKFWNLVSE